MPRSGGIFTLIASYFATPGQTIRTEQHNPVLEDIATALTNSLARDGSAPMLGDLPMNGRKVTGMADGTNPADAVNVSQLPIATVLSPPGQIGWFAMNAAPPGWLKANGAVVSRTTYAALFANMGITWGAGDGTTTFTLPDLRGEFVRSFDDGRGVDPGRGFTAAQAAAMLNHTHSGTTSANGDHNHTPGVGSQFIVTGAGLPQPGWDNGGTFSPTGGHNLTSVDGAHTHTLTTGNPSAGGGSETRPRNIALLACIKF